MLKLKAVYGQRIEWFVIRHGGEEMRVTVGRDEGGWLAKYLVFDGPRSFEIVREKEPSDDHL